MDRFEELGRRATMVGIFGPGAFWRKMGGGEAVRRETGDDFPTVLLQDKVWPDALGAGTRWELKTEHFGIHVFLTFCVTGGPGKPTKEFVGMFCLLDGASRAAIDTLLETTRDANGELGGLPAKMRFFMKGPGVSGAAVISGIVEFDLTQVVNAYALYRITPAADRPTLVHRQCPKCSRKY